MKLYIYRGLDDEEIPWGITHVIVEDSVTVIKARVFIGQLKLVSLIMGDKVKRIESSAFYKCFAIRFIRLSRTLEYIERYAFMHCESLEALSLPSTLKSIEKLAFCYCRSMRLLILPNGINLSNIDYGIIFRTNIQQTAANAGVSYEFDDDDVHNNDIARVNRLLVAVVSYEFDDDDVDNNGIAKINRLSDESCHRVNQWLVHHMDGAPFHKLCYDSSITAKQINDYIIENGKDSALAVDPHHGMTPLHMLSMNPNASVNSIIALLSANMAAAFCLDNTDKTPLDNAKAYNTDGLLAMMNALCTHKNSLDPAPVPAKADESLTNHEILKKRPRTE